MNTARLDCFIFQSDYVRKAPKHPSTVVSTASRGILFPLSPMTKAEKRRKEKMEKWKIGIMGLSPHGTLMYVMYQEDSYDISAILKFCTLQEL